MHRALVYMSAVLAGVLIVVFIWGCQSTGRRAQTTKTDVALRGRREQRTARTPAEGAQPAPIATQEPALVTGWVRDDRGLPIEGAEVSGGSWSTMTDRSGGF